MVCYYDVWPDILESVRLLDGSKIDYEFCCVKDDKICGQSDIDMIKSVLKDDKKLNVRMVKDYE